MDVTLRSSVTDDETAQLWRVYSAIFFDQPDEVTWRAQVWDRHAARKGFRLATAKDGNELVGFAYGYTGEPGQWWTDHAAEVLPPEVAREWLGGHFELVSMGVLPSARGQGVGTDLMRTVTADLTQDRWLLMTSSDTDDPARRLYAREGWKVVGPGLGDDTVILGRRP